MQNQIPNGWQKTYIGNVSVVNMGQSPSSKFYNTERDGIPFYQGVTDFGEKYPSPSLYCSQPEKIAEPGTVLFSVRAPVGDLNFATERSCIGRGVASLDMNNGNNDFLYFMLKNQSGYLKSISGGTVYESINKYQIEKTEVILPTSKEEQKRIATTLTAFDSKIEVNNKIAKNLEQMAQEIFKEWFVNKKENGWEIKQIKDIAKINKGISYSSKEISDFEGLPMINLANFLRGGGFNIEGIKLFTGKYKPSNLVRPGGIVIAMTDLTSNREVIGHPARVPVYSHWDKILVSLDVCSVETESVYVEFLYYLMLRKDFSYLMASSAGGTNVAHLSPKFIETYEFALPDKESIEKFQLTVTPIFKKENLIEMENQRLTKMRDLLLPKLMKGEIRV